MFKSSKEFDTAIHEVLIKFRDGESYKSLSSIYDEVDLIEAIGKASDLGYLTGIFPMRAVSGRLNVDISSNAKVTYEGLQFIENFKN